jgi:hypothetical protein
LAGVDLDVTTYAALAAALSDPTRTREEVLAEHGLDEDAWTQLDERWQERLSSAMDEDVDGVPALVAAYAEAFTRARHGAAGRLSLQRFAEATREIQRRGDPATALARLGIPLAAYLESSAHWTRRIAEAPELAEQFRRWLGGR